jgi:hypothetical protein
MPVFDFFLGTNSEFFICRKFAIFAVKTTLLFQFYFRRVLRRHHEAQGLFKAQKRHVHYRVCVFSCEMTLRLATAAVLVVTLLLAGSFAQPGDQEPTPTAPEEQPPPITAPPVGAECQTSTLPAWIYLFRPN